MFTWLIKDFQSLQDRRYQSEEFNADGCRWSLMIYPNGKYQGIDGKKRLSLYLLVSNYQDLPPGWKVTAYFCLGVENSFSSSYHRRGVGFGLKTFEAKAPSWGRAHWLHHCELDNDGFLQDGRDLEIFAHVQVLDKSGLETPDEIDIVYDDNHHS